MANWYHRKAELRDCRHQVNHVLRDEPLHSSSDSERVFWFRHGGYHQCLPLLPLSRHVMACRHSYGRANINPDRANSVFTLPEYQDRVATLRSIYASMHGRPIGKRSSPVCQPEQATSSVAQKATNRLGLMMLQVYVQSIGSKSAMTKRRLKVYYDWS